MLKHPSVSASVQVPTKGGWKREGKTAGEEGSHLIPPPLVPQPSHPKNNNNALTHPRKDCTEGSSYHALSIGCTGDVRDISHNVLHAPPEGTRVRGCHCCYVKQSGRAGGRRRRVRADSPGSSPGVAKSPRLTPSRYRREAKVMQS
jgi:hypothetical protein